MSIQAIRSIRDLPLSQRLDLLESVVNHSKTAADLAENEGVSVPQLIRNALDSVIAVLDPTAVFEIIGERLNDVAEDKVADLVQKVLKAREPLAEWNRRHEVDRERRKLRFALQTINGQIVSKQLEKEQILKKIQSLDEEILACASQIKAANDLMRKIDYNELIRQKNTCASLKGNLMRVYSAVQTKEHKDKVYGHIKKVDEQISLCEKNIRSYQLAGREKQHAENRKIECIRKRSQLVGEASGLSAEINELNTKTADVKEKMKRIG